LRALVVISPAIMATPVVTSVSQATLLLGSSFNNASSMASDIWSATLSGCPSVTDSEVKRYSLFPIILRLLFNVYRQRILYYSAFSKVCQSKKRLAGGRVQLQNSSLYRPGSFAFMKPSTSLAVAKPRMLLHIFFASAWLMERMSLFTRSIEYAFMESWSTPKPRSMRAYSGSPAISPHTLTLTEALLAASATLFMMRSTAGWKGS